MVNRVFTGFGALAGLLMSAILVAGDEASQPAPNGLGPTGQAPLGQEAVIAGPVLSPEELQSLRSRATARWDALIKRDFDEAYAFASPAYREVFTPQQFAGGFGRAVDWRRVEVLDVQTTGAETALVFIRVFFKAAVSWTDDPFDASLVTEESWVKSADQWWYLPKSKR